AVALVNAALARRLQALPVRCDERAVTVALTDPLDVAVLDDLRFRLGRRIEPVVVSPASLEQAIQNAYDDGAVRDLARRFNGNTRVRAAAQAPTPDELSALRRASEAAPIVELVN